MSRAGITTPSVIIVNPTRREIYYASAVGFFSIEDIESVSMINK